MQTFVIVQDSTKSCYGRPIYMYKLPYLAEIYCTVGSCQVVLQTDPLAAPVLDFDCLSQTTGGTTATDGRTKLGATAKASANLKRKCVGQIILEESNDTIQSNTPIKMQ